MIENYIDTLESCRFCLMCRHVAPAGLVSDLETLTPHGVALIATSQQRGLIDWNEETVGVIFSSPDGGNSRAHCIFNLPHPAAVAAIRTQLVAQNLAPASAYEVDKALKNWGTPFAEQEPQPAQDTAEVALFVGDEAQYLRPETLSTALKLLKVIGIEPALIGIGRSSGFLPVSLGFEQTARELAQATLDELQQTGAKKLLVLSPGDYFTFNQALPERIGLSLPGDIELQEVITLLAEAQAEGRLSFSQAGVNGPYAYVDPTHAVRHAARHDAPRALTAAILGDASRELFFNREKAHPVGSTHVQFSSPDLAQKLTAARLQDALDSGAQTLVCDDPATLHHLTSNENSFQILGLYELLAEHVL